MNGKGIQGCNNCRRTKRTKWNCFPETSTWTGNEWRWDENNIFSVPITIPTSSCPPRGPCGNHTSSPVSTSLFYTFSGDSANFKSSFNIAQYNASGDHIMTPPSSTDGAPFCLPAPHHCAINKCLFLWPALIIITEEVEEQLNLVEIRQKRIELWCQNHIHPLLLLRYTMVHNLPVQMNDQSAHLLFHGIVPVT